jgi:MOSC domain-containing protein YiiM
MSDNKVGKIVDIRLNIGRGEPMKVLDTAGVTANIGLDGDRHARAGSDRQILVMDKAIMQTLEVQPGQLRENITVDGLSLFGLEKGQRIKIGDALELQIGELCDPCENMDAIRPGLQEQIQGQRGLFVTPLSNGSITLGDNVIVAS